MSERYDTAARQSGFVVAAVRGTDFEHRAYMRVSARPQHVRVYLDGDGTPWLHGREVAADPTPRRHLALALMARDPGDVLLVGRPCYHGLAAAPGCESALWTDARYGETVVESLTAAVERVLACCDGASVTLVGYSGGGVLAVLIAERLPRVQRVVTIAANLNVADWVSLHGYRPLAGSLDPAARPAPGRLFAEVHLVGERDRNVPPAIAEAYARTRSGVRVERFETFDHVCCWAEQWPEQLTRLDG